MSRKVLLLGSGGREHALAWRLSKSPSVEHVYVSPGNGGTSTLGSSVENVTLDLNPNDDFASVAEFVNAKSIELVAVGPEQPLVDGIVDALSKAGVACFGPCKAAAQLEGSKAFSKDFMVRHNIPTAQHKSFTVYDEALQHLQEVAYPVVIKASGLAAGKGVVLPETKEEGMEFLREIMVDSRFGSAGSEIVIEERLEGPEVSVLGFCDGNTVALMPAAQDHKRALDGDNGLNTGGMGAYAPAPVLTASLREWVRVHVMQATVDAAAKEGFPYKGVLYAGLMITPNGPRVLEFNCRFGDPETQVILPLLETDLCTVMLACSQGALDPSAITWKDGAAATIVAASGGYPLAYKKGYAISGLDGPSDSSNIVFHAGTKRGEAGAVVTSGGRVLAVTGLGSNLISALGAAYARIRDISFEGMFYRSDIGHRAVGKKLKIGVLGSTKGTDLAFLFRALGAGRLNATIEVVVSNKVDAGILDLAREHGVKAVSVDAKNKSREDYDGNVTSELASSNVDLVVMIGYMRIVSESFVERWEGKIINVHPSLLPDFAGGMNLSVHRAVLEAGRKETGCTVHIVTKEVDAGPILVQHRCPVYFDDTPETLKARVQALEGEALVEAIRSFQFVKPTSATSTALTYAAAGVDIHAGNALVDAIKPYCKATRRTGCDADLGGFGGLFDLGAAGYVGDDTVLVACTDGVGTKLKVAQQCGRPGTVGQDLVAMCVNDLIVQGAEPLFFLDYYATGKLDVATATAVVRGIAKGCELSGCGLIGGETAEMPQMYDDGEYDLAGFSVGAVQRSKILPRAVNAGDILIGIPSSGIHSNGYSLVRKLVRDCGLSYDGPCPFSSSKSTLGEALLTPTRIYVKALMPLIHDGLISALSHITGGGLVENIPRVLPKRVRATFDNAALKLPPVWWIRTAGNVALTEMYTTFNCGVGMVLVVPPGDADAVLGRLHASGDVGSRVIGKLSACKDGEDQVVFV